MRNFSNFEQQIILRMIELDEKPESLNVLGNIYHSFSKELSLPDYCYIDVKSESNITIQVKDGVLNSASLNLHSFDDKVSKMLLTAVKLFEYLENEGLAYFVGNLSVSSIGTVYSDEKYTPCDFLEKESKALIYNYANKKIFITESLKILTENQFKPEEVIRHEQAQAQAATKKQLSYTQFALAFTFIGLLVSIFLPMISVTDINIKNTELKASLDKSTLDLITSESNAVLIQLKTVQKLIEAEGSQNIQQAQVIESTVQNIETLTKRVDALNDKLSEIQEIHNNANSLGRQKAPFVPHSAFWHR